MLSNKVVDKPLMNSMKFLSIILRIPSHTICCELIITHSY